MVKAVSKAVRVSPRKAREVAKLVNGRSVADALVILEHTPRRAATYITKVIVSAKANATNNHNLNEDGLMIKSLQVTEGGTMKRWRPGARSRSMTYQHRMSHISVEIDGKKAPKRVAKKEDDKKKAESAKEDKE